MAFGTTGRYLEFVPRNTYTMFKKKKLQNLSLILSDDYKLSIFHFFCYETSELTLVAIVAKPEVKIAPTK